MSEEARIIIVLPINRICATLDCLLKSLDQKSDHHLPRDTNRVQLKQSLRFQYLGATEKIRMRQALALLKVASEIRHDTRSSTIYIQAFFPNGFSLRGYCASISLDDDVILIHSSYGSELLPRFQYGL